jgi:CysZ protein
MDFFSSLFIGIALPFRALNFLFKHPKYWKYTFVSMILNAALYVLLFYLLFSFVIPWVSSWFPAHTTNEFMSYLYAFCDFIVNFLVIITFFLLFVLVFNAMFFAVAAPFLDGLSLKIEKNLYDYIPEKAGIKGAITGSYISIKNGIWLTIATLFWTLILFPLNFIIPVVGFVPGMLIGSYFLGLSFIIYSVEHRKITKREMKNALRGNRAHVLGFGLCMYWVLFIPFTAILFIPAAVVGGTMLYNEHCGNKD